jgi:hypothetical protein
MPLKRDLYDNERFIQDLTPYEHLHRMFRACNVHYYRLVKLCAVPESVRWLMRSLVCMEHPDWQGTVDKICELGGKPADGTIFNPMFALVFTLSLLKIGSKTSSIAASYLKASVGNAVACPGIFGKLPTPIPI